MNTNPEPKTRSLDESRSLDSLFPSRFLKADHLIAWKITDLTVTIAKLVEEEVQPRPNQMEWKTVIYFHARDNGIHPQGYLLSAKIDKDALKSATGAQTIAQLIGSRIIIQLDTFRGKAVLRIRPTPPPEEEK
ncbi:hypothetical protein LCGC14_0761690 [marine sediment metagenome]|uniref:Uncharacterized protein n=1 Tax=marine sediment metagenome TaxID=412755 RepID=A0A0F9Q110_9ZZZZ|nr:hypothetical protein [bacterium]